MKSICIYPALYRSLLGMLSFVMLLGIANLQADDEADFFAESSPSLDKSAVGAIDPDASASEIAMGVVAPVAIIPPGRPDWLLAAKSRKFQDSWCVVTAGPYPTALECEQELTSCIKQATDDYVNELLGSPLAASLMNLEADDLKAKFNANMLRYEETVNVSQGAWKQIHAKLFFNESFQHDLREKWREICRTSRLLQVGLLSGVVLLLLGTAWGYFRAERKSPGRSPANLQIGSAAAILVIVFAGVMAARWIHWL